MNNITGILDGLYPRLLITIITLTMIVISNVDASAQDNKLIVRFAILKIDTTQLESYIAALKEEIETSIRVESGVLTLNAVADKDNPTHVTILEIYSDTEAYKQHLETPHFKKYKSTTKDMVISLELIEVDPIVLGSKAK